MFLLSTLRRAGKKILSGESRRKFLTALLKEPAPFRFFLNYLVSYYFESRASGYSGTLVSLLVRVKYFDSLGPNYLIDSARFKEPDSVRGYLRLLSNSRDLSCNGWAALFFGVLLFGEKLQLPSLPSLKLSGSELEQLPAILYVGLNRIRRFKVKAFPDTRQLSEIMALFRDLRPDMLMGLVTELNLMKLEQSARIRELFPLDKFAFLDPKIFGSTNPSPNREVRLAPVRLYALENVAVVAGNQVLTQDYCSRYIFDEAQRSEHGWVAGCWENFFYLDSPKSKNGSIFLLDGAELGDGLSSAFLLGGRASRNYFHWLIEDLPKLIAFQEDPEFLSCVEFLVIDANMPRQHFEALDLLIGALGLEHRKIVKRNSDQVIQVERLICSSLHTTHVDRFDMAYWMGGGVRKGAIDFIRKSILANTQPAKGGSLKKIYVTRKKGAARSIKNWAEVEEIASNCGFVPVCPEDLSFKDQVRLFADASFILAQSGAGLSNVIFSRPGTRVVAMTSERNIDYPIYSNLASFVDADFIHLVGKNSISRNNFTSEDEFVHSSFEINPKTLLAVLRADFCSLDQ